MKSLNLSIALWLLLAAGSIAQTILYNPSTHSLIEPNANEFFSANPADGLFFEGSTADTFELSLSIINPTADRTLTFPDADVNLSTDGSGSFEPADPNIAKTDEANTYSQSQTLDGGLKFVGAGGPTLDGTSEFNGRLVVTFSDGGKFVPVSANVFGTSAGEMFFQLDPAAGGHGVIEATGGASGATAHLYFTTLSANGTAGDIIFSPNRTEKMRLALNGLLTFKNAFAPGTTSVNLTSDNQNVTAAAGTSTLLLTSDNATPANRTAILANGNAPGQRLIIIWNDTDAGEIADSGNTNLTTTWTPGQDDTLHLVWTGSKWVETSRSNN